MTDAKAPTYPVPETDEQEAALHKALAIRHLQKLEAAQTLFAGKQYDAFRTKLDELVASNLPAGSATRQNAENLVRFLDTMARGIEQDVQGAEGVVNPAPPTDLVPRPPAMPTPPAV